MLGEEKQMPQLYARKCPKCGTTAVMSRRYCSCHTPLDNAEYVYCETIDIGPCNFETKNFCCEDCLSCKPCASFSKTSRVGRLGGPGCTYFSVGSVRCRCCQALIKFGRKADMDKISWTMILERNRAEPGTAKQFSEYLTSEMERIVKEVGKRETV